MDLDGYFYGNSHYFLYNLLLNQGKRPKNGKLDHIFLGNVEHNMDVP
jgi:hypothetical protein